MIVLDTNAVISHLNQGDLSEILRANQYAVSTITIAELLRLKGIGDEERYVIEDFISSCLVIPVDAKIARTAAEIGRTRATKLPDLLIAATAISLLATLVTDNTRDFKKIPRLRIQNLTGKIVVN